MNNGQHILKGTLGEGQQISNNLNNTVQESNQRLYENENTGNGFTIDNQENRPSLVKDIERNIGCTVTSISRINDSDSLKMSSFSQNMLEKAKSIIDDLKDRGQNQNMTTMIVEVKYEFKGNNGTRYYAAIKDNEGELHLADSYTQALNKDKNSELEDRGINPQQVNMGELTNNLIPYIIDEKKEREQTLEKIEEESTITITDLEEAKKLTNIQEGTIVDLSDLDFSTSSSKVLSLSNLNEINGELILPNDLSAIILTNLDLSSSNQLDLSSQTKLRTIILSNNVERNGENLNKIILPEGLSMTNELHNQHPNSVKNIFRIIKKENREEKSTLEPVVRQSTSEGMQQNYQQQKKQVYANNLNIFFRENNLDSIFTARANPNPDSNSIALEMKDNHLPILFSLNGPDPLIFERTSRNFDGENVDIFSIGGLDVTSMGGTGNFQMFNIFVTEDGNCEVTHTFMNYEENREEEKQFSLGKINNYEDNIIIDGFIEVGGSDLGGIGDNIEHVRINNLEINNENIRSVIGSIVDHMSELNRNRSNLVFDRMNNMLDMLDNISNNNPEMMNRINKISELLTTILDTNLSGNNMSEIIIDMPNQPINNTRYVLHDEINEQYNIEIIQKDDDILMSISKGRNVTNEGRIADITFDSNFQITDQKTYNDQSIYLTSN